MLFHHDPLHSDDFLDAFHGTALDRWTELGGHPAQIELAVERREIDLGRSRPSGAAGSSRPSGGAPAARAS